MKQLAIYGAGGHGQVVADAAELSGWKRVVFFDEAWPERSEHLRWPIVGNFEKLLTDWSDFDGVIVAVGDNKRRDFFSQKIVQLNMPLVKIIHPAAIVSRYACIEPGTVVFACAVINAGSNIGRAVIINTSATIDHDCILGDGVHISPGAHLAGGVIIGKSSWVGIGACIRQNIIVGSDVLVGAGAAVVSDISNGLTVIGIPAVERN